MERFGRDEMYAEKYPYGEVTEPLIEKKEEGEMRYLLILLALLVVGCQDKQPEELPTPLPTLPILNLGSVVGVDSYPLSVDRYGSLIYACPTCPNKWCKEMACRFRWNKGDIVSDCECRREK